MNDEKIEDVSFRYEALSIYLSKVISLTFNKETEQQVLKLPATNLEIIQRR